MKKIYYIEWLDALSRDGWLDVEEAKTWWKKKDLIEDVGFLVKKDKDVVIIAQSISQATGDYGYLKKIPIKTIKVMKELKIPPPKPKQN